MLNVVLGRLVVFSRLVCRLIFSCCELCLVRLVVGLILIVL